MRIAVNTRFLLTSKMEGFGWYTYEICKRLVENNPEHEFIFFFDRPYDERFVFGKNVTPLVLSPPARHPFLFIFWFEVAVKRALKKYKADVFFSPDGYLSLRSPVPQIPVIHDLNFVHNPKDLKPLMSWYYNRFFPKFAKKATEIITVSDYSKMDINREYGIDTAKIHAIWNGASEAFEEVDERSKKGVLDKYTDGKPYVLFVGALHPRKNLKRLMQAFAIAKKDDALKDYQLLIVGTELWKRGLEPVHVTDDVQTSIHFTGHIELEKLVAIYSAATCLAFVPYFEGFGIPLVEAMKCGTPILAANRTSLPEVAGNAALYCDPYNVDDISTKLKELLLSLELQRDLREKGLARGNQFSWDNAAEKVWEVIHATLSKG